MTYYDLHQINTHKNGQTFSFSLCLRIMAECTPTKEQDSTRKDILRQIVDGDNIDEYGNDETLRHLFSLASACWVGEHYVFRRFERLILLDILQYQHELVKLEDHIDDRHGAVDEDCRAKLRKLVREYREF